MHAQGTIVAWIPQLEHGLDHWAQNPGNVCEKSRNTRPLEDGLADWRRLENQSSGPHTLPQDVPLNSLNAELLAEGLSFGLQ